MTTIKVTPEQLLSISRQFEAAQSQVFQMNSILKQHLFEIERQWDGSTKERFYGDFVVAQKVMDNFVSLSLSIAKELQGHAEKFRLADQQVLQSYDPRCAPPPPDECRAPETDTRNAFQKSADSLVELGQAFMQSADDRYQKRYDSIGGFLDYWTFGIPSGLVQGYVDRADKAFNSPNDTANWLTFGIHGTIREATFPTNAWSSEHWANIFGVGGLMLGGGYASSMIKPHNLLTSKGGGARINSFSRPGTGNMTGGFNGFQDQRLQVTENIAESKKARESSKFSEYVEKETSKGTGDLYPTRTIDPIKEAHIISRVKELRSLLTSDYKKSGNFAFAEVDIVNIKDKEFFAHSSIDELSPSLSERVPNISLQPQNPVFKATDAPNKEGVWYPRDSDTEYKILNQIASELKGKTDTVGTIKLFTELDTCLSCNRVIAEFTSKYKNITVEVIHNNGNRIK